MVMRRFSQSASDHSYRTFKRWGERGDADRTVYASTYYDAGDRCQYCATRISFFNFEFDMITCVERGGRNTQTNLAVACKRCNRQKGAKHEAKFAAEKWAEGKTTKLNKTILDKFNIEPRIQLSLPFGEAVAIKKAA